VASDADLPSDFEARSRERYAAISKPELTFEQFFDIDAGEYRRVQQASRSATYNPTPSPLMTPCGNGGLETSLDPNEWQGGWGSVASNGDPTFSTFTAGLSPGALNSAAAHQTWVAGGGTDPVGIPLTAQGSAGAVRIGNAVAGFGSEVLSKTFTVTAAQSLLRFWYAVVLEDPGHTPATAQPSFWVRVLDASTNYLPNLVNLGNGTDKIVAANTAFFQTFTPPGGGTPVRYKNWSCAQIDLSKQVGQVVTIQFVTEDCTAGAHYGYAYVDGFCGTCKGSPEGDISLDAGTSSTCPPPCRPPDRSPAASRSLFGSTRTAPFSRQSPARR